MRCVTFGYIPFLCSIGTERFVQYLWIYRGGSVLGHPFYSFAGELSYFVEVVILERGLIL